jgi:CBS domain-containing protein
MEAVTVRDVMRPLTEFIDENQSIAMARQRMQGVEAIRSLLVTDASGQLVGAVRYTDISQAESAGTTVGDIAISDVPVARASQPLEELIGVMTTHNLDRLPVVDEQGVVIGELPRAVLSSTEHTAESGAGIRSLVSATEEAGLARPEIAVERDKAVLGPGREKNGTLKEVLVDSLNNRLTHILVHTGWLFGKDHAVPADLIEGVQDGNVQLKVGKDEVAVLPDLQQPV